MKQTKKKDEPGRLTPEMCKGTFELLIITEPEKLQEIENAFTKAKQSTVLRDKQE